MNVDIGSNKELYSNNRNWYILVENVDIRTHSKIRAYTLLFYLIDTIWFSMLFKKISKL